MLMEALLRPDPRLGLLYHVINGILHSGKLRTVGLLKNPGAKHLLSTLAIQNAVKWGFRGSPTGLNAPSQSTAPLSPYSHFRNGILDPLQRVQKGIILVVPPSDWLSVSG